MTSKLVKPTILRDETFKKERNPKAFSSIIASLSWHNNPFVKVVVEASSKRGSREAHYFPLACLAVQNPCQSELEVETNS